ncbi:small nuclear ribonucleoprotein G-like [Fukomys damarensis]|uniref:small nuclear ribonucleoprotein G-like n=1 Tax=Fukomys damarensis TaxID=885580 RepID=UPI001455C477|nr:small nuclear ribonucleoprotein G-like [Fukomys damarensis]
MSKAHVPELKTSMEKMLSLILNSDRHVQGISWRFDSLINFVKDKCVKMATSVQLNNTRMVII